MPTLNLTTSASGVVGTASYTWSYNQTTGAAVGNTSIANTTSATAIFTYPSTITYQPGASTGTYGFTFQCIGTDSGVSSCTAVRTIVLWFLVTPPSCSISLSSISIS